MSKKIYKMYMLPLIYWNQYI